MRRWRWAAGCAAVLAAFALGRVAQQGVAGPKAASQPMLAVAAMPDNAASTAAPRRIPGLSRAASASANTPQGAQVEAPSASASSRLLEVCGVGMFSEADLQSAQSGPADGGAVVQGVEAQMQRRAERALTQVSARLAAGTERQQVAARLLMGDREGAAMLAERSSDALAYQMALTACGSVGEGANCARLNPRRWAELDPLDARPWLRLMDEAHRRKDAAGVDAALAQAAARPRLSRGFFLLEAQAAAVADVIPDAAEFGQALVAVIGIDAAMPGFDMAVPMRHCRGEGLRDPTRLGHCRALARQALANASDLAEAGVALKLAERVGVPREQQAYDAATLKAAQEKFSERALADVGMDCAAMRRLKQLSTERAAAGELAMALALLPARKPVPAP